MGLPGRNRGCQSAHENQPEKGANEPASDRMY
jgi:hypothetical protein